MNKKRMNIVKNILILLGIIILVVLCVIVYLKIGISNILLNTLCFSALILILIGKGISILSKKDENVKSEIITTLILVGILIWAVFFSK